MGRRWFAKRWCTWSLGAGLGLSLLGCHQTWDKMTSSRFKEKPFQTLFSSEDPIEVLRNSPEGDERIRAMQALKEPIRDGKSQAEQDEVIQILTTTATTHPSGLCRLAAIETLARFQDPRAPEILINAYHTAVQSSGQRANLSGVEQAGFRSRSKLTTYSDVFTPETITTIRCRTLEALGANRSPQAFAILSEVAVKPTNKREAPNPDELFPQIEDGVNEFDIRLAAIRALANYKGEPQAAQVLLQVLKSEKDVAIRVRAHEGLVAVTGKNLPPDADSWAKFLQGEQVPEQSNNVLERIGISFP